MKKMEKYFRNTLHKILKVKKIIRKLMLKLKKVKAFKKSMVHPLLYQK
jgi:hypothetical protein